MSNLQLGQQEKCKCVFKFLMKVYSSILFELFVFLMYQKNQQILFICMARFYATNHKVGAVIRHGSEYTPYSVFELLPVQMMPFPS